MKLCDLQKLAEVYGVHVSALLMAPDDHPKAERMRKAATLAENITVMITVYTALAAIIAVGVVYNFSRIALSEQGRELASLRVLGFTKAEVSGVVFAGSSQFVAVSLMAAGAALPVIWLTTLVVNLRHALYSAALLPHAQGLSARWRWCLAFWLTDETFAVVEHRLRTQGMGADGQWFWLGSSLAMYLNWLLWTVVGVAVNRGVKSLSSRCRATAIGGSANTQLMTGSLPGSRAAALISMTPS